MNHPPFSRGGSVATDAAFRYHRRVQFAETDMVGLVHFSTYFKYMEEAEHALWRAAGMTIASMGEEAGWPRVAATFEFKAPLHFQEEFVVAVRIAEVSRRTMQYACAVTRGHTRIGTGTITVASVRKRSGEPMKAVDLPAGVVERLRAAIDADPSHANPAF